MASIKTTETGIYRIPLTVTLSDSTHGEIKAFELITCRVRDSEGAEGVGYTYTVGRNGGAHRSLKTVRCAASACVRPAGKTSSTRHRFSRRTSRS